MQLGLGLPNGGARVDPAELVRLAVGAEGIGLDAVWVVERWLRPLAPVAVPGVPAARIGDGVHPYRNDLAQLADELGAWRAAARRAGRDPARMPVVLRAAADPGAPRREAFTGPVAAWAEDVAAVAGLGVGHVMLQFPPGADPDRERAAMAELRAAVPRRGPG